MLIHAFQILLAARRIEVRCDASKLSRDTLLGSLRQSFCLFVKSMRDGETIVSIGGVRSVGITSCFAVGTLTALFFGVSPQRARRRALPMNPMLQECRVRLQ